MKKSKLIVGLSAAFVGLIALASCSGSVTSAGEVLLYYNGQPYTAEDLFNEKVNTPDAAQAAFNAVYKVAVRNWANTQESGLKKEIENETKNKVSSAKADASSNASKNGTSYDVEFNKILSSNGVDSEAALYNKFEYDIQKTKFEDKFYENNYEILKNGGYFNKLDESKLTDKEKQKLKIGGYIDNKHPYHMKHILIKLTESANFKQEEITKKNAEDIYTVINALAKGEESFGLIAATSEDYGDSSSAKERGSVGIMDVDTSFVDEFKLGTYLFECFYNSSTLQEHKKDDYSTNGYTSEVAYDKLFGTNEIAKGFADEINKYKDPSSNDLMIGTIPFGAVEKLKEYATIEFDKGFAKLGVTKNNKFLPRNVIFNKYFNRHNICVITSNKLKDISPLDIYNKSDTTKHISGSVGEEKKNQKELYRGVANYTEYTNPITSSGKDYKGFDVNHKKRNDSILETRSGGEIKEIWDEKGSETNQTFLRDTDGRIIFVVRGKDGLHIISIERSPFITREKTDNAHEPELTSDKSGVTLDEYYTTYYPTEPNGNYPKYDDVNEKPTFVKYTGTPEPVKYKSLAKTVKDKLKSSNPNLSKIIYNYFIHEGNLSFNGQRGVQIQGVIDDWITRSIESTKFEDDEKWNKSWHDYYWKLQYQNEKRTETQINGSWISGIVPEVCATAIAKANIDQATTDANYVGFDTLTALFGPGGIFYEK